MTEWIGGRGGWDVGMDGTVRAPRRRTPGPSLELLATLAGSMMPTVVTCSSAQSWIVQQTTMTAVPPALQSKLSSA